MGPESSLTYIYLCFPSTELWWWICKLRTAYLKHHRIIMKTELFHLDITNLCAQLLFNALKKNVDCMVTFSVPHIWMSTVDLELNRVIICAGCEWILFERTCKKSVSCCRYHHSYTQAAAKYICQSSWECYFLLNLHRSVITKSVLGSQSLRVTQIPHKVVVAQNSVKWTHKLKIIREHTDSIDVAKTCSQGIMQFQ